jgi:hypothetical protein
MVLALPCAASRNRHTIVRRHRSTVKHAIAGRQSRCISALTHQVCGTDANSTRTYEHCRGRRPYYLGRDDELAALMEAAVAAGVPFDPDAVAEAWDLEGPLPPDANW